MEQQIQREAPPDTKRMVQQLQETTGVAADMMQKLHEQGGQLDRIVGLNDEASAALSEAERQAKRLSVRGRISNLFRRKHRSQSLPAGRPEEQHKDDKHKGKEDKETKDDGWVDRSQEDPFHGLPPELSTAQVELVKEQDRDLDQMSDILSSLKEMSLATGNELNSQSKKIDHIDHQVDKNLYSLNKTNRRIAR